MVGVRLDWDGKSSDVPRLHLPLQTVETVNASRADRGTLLESTSTDKPDWHNLLIWGENLHALATLADTYAGKIDLIYIDPPFDSRQDYKVRIAVGDGNVGANQDLAKLSSIIEEKAYRDTWGKGVESYLQMLYERLILLKELMSDRASLFLHLAPTVSHYARALLDELFPGQFRAEIIWKRTSSHSSTHDFGPIHETISVVSKTSDHIWHPQFTDYDEDFVQQYYRFDDGDGRKYWPGDITAPGIRKGASGQTWRGWDPTAKGRHWGVNYDLLDDLDRDGRIYWPTRGSGFPMLKRYLDEAKGMPIGDVWADIKRINQVANERLGYDTQKPEALLERIIKSSSDPNSIVLDCFVGSGTTTAVAERLGRRWIGIDIGRFAVHTTRKRMLDIPACRPFVVANLGQYERQVWQEATTGMQIQDYLDFIVRLYRGKPKAGGIHVHGEIGTRAIHVGAVDSPVSAAEVIDAASEARSLGYQSIDCLGWEFELGLHALIQDEARAIGIKLQLRRIPREIMDPRVVASGEVIFHELAHVKVLIRRKKRRVYARLEDFVVPNPDLIPASIQSKVCSWADYVDYWAIDFTYDTTSADATFHNQWQSFRTRRSRKLELEAEHDYALAGYYTLLVKVVDIFGNDTTQRAEVTVA